MADKRERREKQTRRAKTTKAIVARRVEEILRIRLDGAEFWDILQYVAEQQKEEGSIWAAPDGGKPFAARTVWWYIQKADRLIAETFRNERGRKRLIRRHLAQRRNLYAKAVSQGDIRAALACLDSEAKLAGLFDDELNRTIDAMQREIEEIKKRHGDGHAEKTTCPAAARPGEPDAPGEPRSVAAERRPGPAAL
jgi:hypothetical protein